MMPEHERPIRILLVEDEAAIAMLIEDMVADIGGELVATATRLDDAMAQASEREIDFAILDLNLAGVLTYPVADLLKQRGIPFVFATGYGAGGLAKGYENETALDKPFTTSTLERVMKQTLALKPV
jgi:CheY-like chemotaxis protein